MTGELGAGDALPPGPYACGLTKGPRGETAPPWTVICGRGQAVAGHVPSREIAEAIAFALNMPRPAERPQNTTPTLGLALGACPYCGQPRANQVAIGFFP